MKFTSLFIISAFAFCSVSAVEVARAAVKCNTNGQTSLILNSIQPSTGEQVLKTLKDSKLKVVFSLTKENLGGDFVDILNKAQNEGHTLIYSYTNDKVMEVTDEKFLEEIKNAQQRFQEVFKTGFKYVRVPFSSNEDSKKRFAYLVALANLIPVGHSMYLSGEIDADKNKLRDNLYGDKSFIVVAETSSKNINETIKSYNDRVNLAKFDDVSLDVCLSGKAVNEVVSPKASPVNPLPEKKFDRRRRQNRRVLVNPKYIEGYGEDKPVNGEKQEANVDKDFDMKQQAQLAGKDGKPADAADSSSAAGMTAGISSVIVALSVGLISLL